MSTTHTESFVPVHVGTSPAGVEYVAYKPEHVETLRRSLERAWARARRSNVCRVDRLSEGVIHVMEVRLSAWAENGEDVSQVKIRSRSVTAPALLLLDFADAICDAADDIEDGLGGLAESSNQDLPFGFCEATDKRRAQSMRRHAARMRRLAK